VLLSANSRRRSPWLNVRVALNSGKESAVVAGQKKGHWDEF
jgi:hypothetical protein